MRAGGRSPLHISPKWIIRGHVERLESRVLLAAAGPDGYGYVADPHPFEDIDLAVDDPAVQRFGIDLGLNTFNYYGRTYTGSQSMAVHEDGAIQVGDFGSLNANTRLASGPFQPIIAALWDNSWSHPAGSMSISKLEDTGGDAAADRLIVQWNVLADHGLPVVRFQAILELNTGSRPGDIILNYVSLESGRADNTNGGSATVGIKDFGYNSNRLLISFNSATNPLVADGTAIRMHNDSTGQPFAHAGRTALADEGVDIRATLDGSRSFDPNQSPTDLTYAWDLDLDGVYGESAADSFGDETGPRPTFVRNDGSVVNGPTAFPVVLRVTDASGFTSFGKGWVGVRNVIGTTTITGPSTAAPGTEVTLTLAGTDPGNDIVGWDVDWGDGIRELINLPATTATHTFYLPGTKTITAGIVNTDNLRGNSATHTVTIGALPDLQLDAAGVLMVSGTSGDDTVTLDTDAGNARLTRNGVVTSYALADVKAIALDAAGGNNTVTVSLDIPVSVLAGDGNDTITVGVGRRHEIRAGGGNNSITTGAQLTHGFDATVVVTGAGDDVINVPGIADLIDAGDGDNVVNVQFAQRVITGSGDDVISVTVSNGTLNCFSGDGDDSITSGSGSDTIDCGNGNDTVSSGALSDYITAGGDVTTGVGAIIDGGEAPDRIQARFARRIVGGDEDGQFSGDTIVAGHCPDVDGGGGNDIIRVGSDASHPAVVHGGDGNDHIFTGDGHDSIYGGAGKDTVHGGSGSDLISGGGGHDLLFGQGGKDRLYGGAGNDRLFGQGGDDRLLGGLGADTIHGGADRDAVTEEDSIDRLISIETM